MVKALYENLKHTANPRADLIALKQEVKKQETARQLRDLLQGDYSLFFKLLQDFEPKVRKNAALILGSLGAEGAAGPIYEAYRTETQMFVRSDYLKALAGLDYGEYRKQLGARLKELEAYHPAEAEEKHIREELTALRKLVDTQERHDRHVFRGYDESYEVILTTGKLWQELTMQQIKDGKVTRLGSGVRVATSSIGQVQKIPTYRELLFPLDVRRLDASPQQAAAGILDSNLQELLKKAHKTGGTYYFRLGIHSRMPLDKRSAFSKKCAFALEQGSEGKLRNSTSDYEIEIRLMENKDGTFLPLVKLYTLEDKRFSYRKNVVSASIRPQQAAVAAALARPYMEEHAQILDPFCGVGTMLLERDRVCPARVMYGVDIFGEAIEKARENTRIAGKNIYYVNRDFFQFTHAYLFDEIITDMPERGKREKEELDALYGRFFEKANAHLKLKGVIFMYSNEKNFVKKQMRLHPEFVMYHEYPMDEKENYHLFIIGKRG